MDYENRICICKGCVCGVGDGGVLLNNAGRYVIVFCVGRYVRCSEVGRNGLLPHGFCLFPQGCFYRDEISLPFPYTFSWCVSLIFCPQS